MAKSQPSQNTKLGVLMRDDFICIYCEKKITKPYDATVDHVLPKKHGGGNHAENLAACCQACNADKGNLLLTQYLRAFEIPVTVRIARFL